MFTDKTLLYLFLMHGTCSNLTRTKNALFCGLKATYVVSKCYYTQLPFMEVRKLWFLNTWFCYLDAPLPSYGRLMGSWQ